MKLLGQKYGVKVTIDFGHRMGRIRLQGQNKDVAQAEIYVRERLHKVKAKLREEEEAAMVAQLVRTFFLATST